MDAPKDYAVQGSSIVDHYLAGEKAMGHYITETAISASLATNTLIEPVDLMRMRDGRQDLPLILHRHMLKKVLIDIIFKRNITMDNIAHIKVNEFIDDISPPETRRK